MAIAAVAASESKRKTAHEVVDRLRVVRDKLANGAERALSDVLTSLDGRPHLALAAETVGSGREDYYWLFEALSRLADDFERIEVRISEKAEAIKEAISV